MTRFRRWWPATTGDQLALVTLGVLVLAGLALRATVMNAFSPGFVGYSDAGFYLGAASAELFDNALAPAGYPTFLRLLHGISSQLSFAIGVQHLLGVAAALLLFASVRRVAPAVWGLVPAGVVLLAGPQLFLEHATLAEPLFVDLLAALIYCATRALAGRPLLWATLAGLLAAGSACTRSVGLALCPLVVVWLVLAVPGPPRLRLQAGVVAGLAAWALLGSYVLVARNVTGYVDWTLSRVGGEGLYFGVTSFADCTRFEPPEGTRVLCDPRPPAERPAPQWYMQPEAPMLTAYAPLEPRDNKLLIAFGRAAILHQPVDWIRNTATDFTRFWSSSAHERGGPDSIHDDYDGLLAVLLFVRPDRSVQFGDFYPTLRPALRMQPRTLNAMVRYYRNSCLEGPALVLLVLAALIGVPLARGDQRKLGAFVVGVCLVVVVAPVASTFFTARFAVPGYGPLAAAGALGGASLWARAISYKGRLRGQGPLPEGTPVGTARS